MEDTKDQGDGSGRRRRRSVDHQGQDRLLDVPGSWPTRRRSCEVPDAGNPSRIPVRSPASTPTMPRRLTAFSLARLNKTSQSLRSLDREEVDSVGGRSSSCECDHPHFPGNGTTFSGRTKRYVVHCSPTHSCSPDEYLTPTQRANHTIRKLKAELAASQAELTDREREIARLTREIVQLRLRKLEESQDEEDSSPESRLASTPTRIVDLRNGPDSTRVFERSPGARLSSRNLPNGIDSYRERSPGGGLRDYRDVSPSTLAKDYRDYPSPPSHSESRPSSSRAGDYRDFVDRLPIRDYRDGISPSDYSDGVVKEYQGSVRPSSSQDYRDDHSAFRPIRLCNDLGDPPPFPIPSLPLQGHGRSSCGSEVAASLADSGHFEELSPHHSPRTSALEKEIESLKLEHLAHVRQMKTSTDLIIEELQDRIRDANIRCEALKPQLEEARQRLADLEKEKEELQVRYDENEQKHKEDYLKMYNKGQQAAIIQSDASTSDGPPSDIPSLLKQLEVSRQELESVKTMYRRCLETKKTKNQEDAEITLKFLKSAIFYFLTDRENSAGHLAAIMSILGFNEEERAAIDKWSYTWKY